MATKIAIANQKGGIGKTTTALALSTGLIKRGFKVLLVDTDPQRSATSVYGAVTEGEATLADIMYDGAKGKECIQSTNLGDIIASDQALKVAENKIPVDTDRFYHLSDAMAGVEEEYDYIVFDTPPGNGVLLGNVLSYIDYVVIPIICDSFGIRGLRDFYDTIGDYKKRINRNLKIAGLLRVKYKGRQVLTKDIEDNILPQFAKEMDTVIFDSTISESVKCQEAQASKVSIFDYAPKCTTTVDYEKFIDELLKRIGE